ncbi:hypothetical protein B4107_3377 [Bacillus safensis]|nr:hypothetical protein B4107_3377 [Bacillus safensis]
MDKPPFPSETNIDIYLVSVSRKILEEKESVVNRYFEIAFFSSD